MITGCRQENGGVSVEMLHIDCMAYMKGLDDNAFDLAIVDPPYGIGDNWKKDRFSDFYTHESTYKNDSIPDSEYFSELFRVSSNQIIWGANYYTDYLPPRQSWIVWDKDRDYEQSHMAEGELAWTSFNIPVRILKRTWNGFIRAEPRHGNHPHEKPTGLYQWILEKYSEQGQRILDTHLGSGSSAIAANYFGCDFVGCEIDKNYYDAACKRFDMETRQVALL